MKKTARFLIKPLIFLILVTTFLPPNPTFATSPFAGIWEGTLSDEGTALGLSFEIIQNEDSKETIDGRTTIVFCH